jgi:hypothetical protein
MTSSKWGTEGRCSCKCILVSLGEPFRMVQNGWNGQRDRDQSELSGVYTTI